VWTVLSEEEAAHPHTVFNCIGAGVVHGPYETGKLRGLPRMPLVSFAAWFAVTGRRRQAAHDRLAVALLVRPTGLSRISASVQETRCQKASVSCSTLHQSNFGWSHLPSLAIGSDSVICSASNPAYGRLTDAVYQSFSAPVGQRDTYVHCRILVKMCSRKPVPRRVQPYSSPRPVIPWGPRCGKTFWAEYE